MKTLNTNHHRHFRFAAAILAVGYFTVAGSVNAGDDVPFKLKGSAYVDLDADDLECDPVPGFLVNYNKFFGEATATQLGNHTFEGDQCVLINIVDYFDQDLPIMESEFYQTQTHTAANGDELHLTVTGTFVLLKVRNPEQPFLPFLVALSGEGEYVITGGTGRFEDATGSGVGTSSLTPDNEFIFEYEGLISSLGSRGGNGKKKGKN